MSKFSTLKQKLKKIWENASKNTSDLKITDNTSQVDVLNNISQQSINKTIFELYDSGLITTSPTYPSDSSFSITKDDETRLTTSVNKNVNLPEVYTYSHGINIDVPETFLPFLKITTQVQNIPDYNLVLANQFQSSRFGEDNDVVSINGDNNVLYLGSPENINASTIRTNELLSEFNQQELTAYKIPLANTKRVFNIKIFYRLSGKDYTIDGRVTDMQVRYDTDFTCNQESDVYDGEFFQEGITGSERYDNEILNLTNNAFSIKAKKTETKYIDIPPCTASTTHTDGVSKNDSFNNTTSYSISVLGSWTNETDNIFLGNNQKITVDTNSVLILSKEVNFIGYRVYYDNLTQGVLSVKEGSSDGNFLNSFELFANNLPNTDDGHTLSYTTIFFKRNFDTFDRTVFETDDYIQHSKKELPIFLKKTDDTYYMTVAGDYILSNPTIDVAENSRQFPKYDDEYTVVGTTYERTSENHSFADTPVYVTKIADSQIRILLYLQNTIHWREEKKYVL